MALRSQKARAQQERLIRRYTEALPGRLERITECWQQMRSGGWDDESLARLKTEVHQLAGSAGSYGFAALGDDALALDGALTADCSAASERRRVEQYVTRLLDALNELANST